VVGCKRAFRKLLAVVDPGKTESVNSLVRDTMDRDRRANVLAPYNQVPGVARGAYLLLFLALRNYLPVLLCAHEIAADCWANDLHVDASVRVTLSQQPSFYVSSRLTQVNGVNDGPNRKFLSVVVIDFVLPANTMAILDDVWHLNWTLYDNTIRIVSCFQSKNVLYRYTCMSNRRAQSLRCAGILLRRAHILLPQHFIMGGKPFSFPRFGFHLTFSRNVPTRRTPTSFCPSACFFLYRLFFLNLCIKDR
jgi:hypothetical protein